MIKPLFPTNVFAAPIKAIIVAATARPGIKFAPTLAETAAAAISPIYLSAVELRSCPIVKGAISWPLEILTTTVFVSPTCGPELYREILLPAEEYEYSST